MDETALMALADRIDQWLAGVDAHPATAGNNQGQQPVTIEGAP